MLRVTCAQLLQVCEAELRLFQKLFGHDLSDEIFVMGGINIAYISRAKQREGDTENAFEDVVLKVLFVTVATRIDQT